jgi:hypothetical protein
VSWWSTGDEEYGCSKPPIQTWVSDEFTENGKTTYTFCAVIEAETVDDLWQNILKFYPDCEKRFCIQRPDNFTPPDKFTKYQEKVSFNPPKKPKKLPLEIMEALIETERDRVVETQHKKGKKPKCCKINKKKGKSFCARA